MREGAETPEGRRRIGNPRRFGGQEIFEKGTRGCTGTPNARVGERMQRVRGPVHQENLQSCMRNWMRTVLLQESRARLTRLEAPPAATPATLTDGTRGTSGENCIRFFLILVKKKKRARGQDAVEWGCASRCDQHPCIARRPPGHRRVDGFKKPRFAGCPRVRVSGRDLVRLKSVAVHGGSDFSRKSKGTVIDEADAKRVHCRKCETRYGLRSVGVGEALHPCPAERPLRRSARLQAQEAVSTAVDSPRRVRCLGV